ncbi:glycerophosphodiester phosphodiesterase [Actinocorallia sp. A-T 12471]|uniref:glycerophosphodiester phosphodiesterase n=1 Tax=Actinocorallia sp. A-T 12471 TaxID=3089813 RepID=UPI0029D06CDA|nr:glycerophosphodiester phosphodiesterase [Actinocorallia sp. A-T 12471]MDX6745091.1 glycerophosphodiester phosphodiesterase [Actinocorallia sp. A-T 12471]
MMFDGGPTIIGHRGLGGGAGENTLPSLLGAVEAGLSWVEIDVQRTADDRLVLAHDPVGEDGSFHVDGPAGDRLTLEEVFAALPPHVGIDVDVKTVLEDALEPRTAPLLKDILKQEATRRPLIVTSFDPSVLLALDGTGIPRGLLTWLWFPIGHAIASAAGLGLEAIALHTASCDPTPKARPFADCVDIAHKAGLDVLVWTPKPEALTPYLPADALVVDDIPGTLKALNR